MEGRWREAATLLWAAWQAGERVNGLPDACRPSTRAEGYAVQAAVEAVSGRAVVGWKIAATSTAGQAHIAVGGPLAGRVLDGQVDGTGAEISLDGNLMRVAEPEFAFRMERALPPRERAYAVAEVLAAVGTLHPALELPDSRFVDVVAAGEAQLVADTACAHRLVLGPAAPDRWREVDLSAHPVAAEVAGRYTRDGSGAAVLGDPRVALTWLANELSRLGVTLDAGQVVTTGTCMAPLDLAPGDAVTARYGDLGHVGVLLTA